MNSKICSGEIITGDVSLNDTGITTETYELVTDVSNGTLIFGTDGTFTYTPDVGFVGSDIFTYRVCDPSVPCCETATVDLEIFDLPDLDEGYFIDNGPYMTGSEVSVCPGQDIILNFNGSSFEQWTFEWTGPNGFTQTNNDPADGHNDRLVINDITVAQAGVYDVIFTDPNGCQGTGSFTVTVSDFTASIDQEPTVCPGESVTLTALLHGNTYSCYL